MRPAPLPSARHLILVGGGHAHLGVLRALAMRPEPGLALTLIADEMAVIYSGMLPGLVAGLYRPEECRVDLLPLATAAGARLIRDRVEGIDLAGGRVLCARHPPIGFDLLSLDIGSEARLEVPGAADHALPVRPIGSVPERLAAALDASTGALRIAVVGGGAGGAELALSLRHRLAAEGRAGQVTLLAGRTLLPRQPGLARALVRQALRARDIAILEGAEVARVDPGPRLVLADGRGLDADLVLWATGAAAAAWPGEAGLETDPRGFIAVDAGLRSVSDPRVFAAGDCAAVLPHPREKAGVYAVRQGPPLAENLRRAARGEAPRPFRPQRTALALVGTGDGKAVALRGSLGLPAARWLWRWKDRIDRRWIEAFAALRGDMPGAEAGAAPMRCAGCGGKLPAEVLSAALATLPAPPASASGPEVLLGLAARDDAAIFRSPGSGPGGGGQALVQTVDQFRAFLGDLHLFGRIAANHALGDIHAMGGQPFSALAIATLPPGPPARQAEDLAAMLRGAQEVLEAAGARLLGGHSGEGAEVALGFAVTGTVDPARALRLSGLAPGDRLVLTKPLGTGVLLAAAMRGEAAGAWLEAAVAAMQEPLGPAADVVLAHGARAGTDVTGFGLLGHLGGMLRASGVAARLDPAAVPLLPGAAEAFARGIRGTLHPANAAAVADLLDGTAEVPPALLDPQTAGGLLVGIPGERVAACLAALRAAGVAAPAVVGVVEDGPPRLRFLAAGAPADPAPRAPLPAGG